MSEKKLLIEKKEFRALGTEIDVQIVVSDSEKIINAKDDIKGVENYYLAIEKKFSRFDSLSELSYFNNNLGKKIKASPEMLDVAKRILLRYEQTDGFFDPRIINTLEAIGYDRDFKEIANSIEKKTFIKNFLKKKLSEDLIVDNDEISFLVRMDFSGLVKGWVTDRVCEMLSARGWKNFLVDSGGDMFFRGKDTELKKWKVDIEGILFEKLMLELSENGIATSGIGKRKWEKNGKRFHHIINPKKIADFSFDLQSVTVVADLAEDADVWAKTIFINGKDNGMKMAMEKDIACAILEYSGRVWISPAIKKYLYQNV